MEGRFVARLKRLSGATVAQMANELGLQVEGEHPQVIARACRKSVSLRRVVDATLSIKDPLPEWALNNVILAPDLCQHVLRIWACAGSGLSCDGQRSRIRQRHLSAKPGAAPGSSWSAPTLCFTLYALQSWTSRSTVREDSQCGINTRTLACCV